MKTLILAAILAVIALTGELGLFALAVIPIAVLYGLPEYREARRIKEIEESLPDVLFQASSMTSIASFDELIKQLGEGGHGELSRLFNRAHRQIEGGIPVEEALEELQREGNSELLSRTLKLLLQGYRTGADISLALRETANDISQTHEILRERTASTTVEKYTLLLAGGCIVPLILGVLVSMVSEIGFVDIGTGMDWEIRKAIIENASLGNQVYIGEYALLASFFVGIQESNPKKALIYAGILVPISLSLFLLAKTISIAF